MTTESLIGIIPGHSTKQTDISDKRACILFEYFWNRFHPDYRVKVVNNSHDFGIYPDIGISESLFEQGIDDNEEFPQGGIEIHSGLLCDIWNGKVIQNKIPHEIWQRICERTGLTDKLPFTMEY